MTIVKHFIMATAGHVDHGKSTLIKALTGTDPDRLPEEKSRGITIDLGFAHLELPARGEPEAAFHLGIVDVPGHEYFVKNMVAGVGSVDLALLVVAADDGWMPQTEEHLQILTYLGVSRAVIALTKIDLVEDQQAAAAKIQEKLRNTPFEASPVIATSVVARAGLDQLKESLRSVLAEMTPPREIGKPRLPIDRVFKLQGVGTVVTGTLTGGALRRGQKVVLQPSGKKARVRSIQSHNREVEGSGPGTRTALSLPDLDAALDVGRGDTVTLESLGEPSSAVDVQLQVSARASRSIKEGSRVRVHHGSGNVAAKVFFYQTKNIEPGQRALAQLRLEAPTFFFTGDRFIIRDWPGQNTIAGGMILDPDSDRRSFREKARLQFLIRRDRAPDDIVGLAASHIAYAGAAHLSRLLLRSRHSTAEISQAVSQLASAGQAVLTPDYVFDSEKWNDLRLRASGAIDAHHKVHPEKMGLPLVDLRALLKPDLPDDALFDSFLSGLCNGDFVRAGTTVWRAGHSRRLPPQLEAASQKVRASLAAKVFDPPSLQELAPDPLSQQAVRLLIETGEAVEINSDIVMTHDSMKKAVEVIRGFIRDHGPATVSELRQSLASSRRVVVPLLERLDREGVTLRQNDRRTLRR